ncbi:MAG: hypothetical protein KG028_02130 [Actinobacteria bacterium]|nr:hypothetical protein [Actinomycetota bacterium]
MGRQQLQRILADDYLDGLTDWSTADLRTARADCEAEEEAVSYARRLMQGRLDILRDELQQRDGAGDADGEVTDVLARLASVLSVDRPAPGSSPLQARATRLRVPAAAADYEEEVDQVVGGDFLEDLHHRPTSALAEAVERLAAHEHELSQARRGLFDRIDRLRDELARRYKDGSAAVSDLFGGA